MAALLAYGATGGPVDSKPDEVSVSNNVAESTWFLIRLERSVVLKKKLIRVLVDPVLVRYCDV